MLELAHHNKPREAGRDGGRECYLGWAGVGVVGLMGEHLGHRSEFAPNCPNRLKGPFSFLKHLLIPREELTRPANLIHYIINLSVRDCFYLWPFYRARY